MKNKNKKCMKIAEKDFTNKLKIVTEIFWKKRKTYKENIGKLDIRTCQWKINKN